MECVHYECEAKNSHFLSLFCPFLFVSRGKWDL